MKQKVFTLLTLLVLCMTGAWAATESISWAITTNTLTIAPTITPSLDAHLSNASTSISLTTFGSTSSSKDGYCKPFYNTNVEFNASTNYASISFKIADGYTFTPSSLGMTVYSHGTGNLKYKVIISDSKATPTTVTSNEIQPSSGGEAPITFADGAFTGKTLEGTVTIKLYAYNYSNSSTGKRSYIKSPITISGNVASKAAKAYTVTTETNDEDMGTAVADDATLDEGETTTVTATPKSGYKFVSWAVSGTGASLSSTTTNPTTLTMGTANATVTATFAALETYTISYAKGSGDGITGSKDNETKYENVAFTLPSSPVFTRSGYVQTGWATSDGGTKAYELGGSYTTNADQTFYPFWTEAYTLTYNSNGGTGTMTDSEGVGSITLKANAFTKTGYTFVGWATSQANADAGTVAYNNAVSYTLSENTTLYAVWSETAYTFVSTGTANETVTVDGVVSGSTGGTMVVTQGTVTYGDGFLEFSYVDKKVSQVQITLNKVMQVGSYIVGTLSTTNNTTRGLKLVNSAGTEKANWSEASDNVVRYYIYKVVAGDGFAGSKVIKLYRNNNVNLDKLEVTNCIPGEPSDPVAEGTTVTLSTTANMNGWRSYNNNSSKKYTVSANTKVYYASATGDNKVTLEEIAGGVPANTAVILHKTDAAGAAANIVLTETDASITAPGAANKLAVSTAGQNLGKVYRLGYKTANGVGFYTYTTTSAPEGIIYVSSVSGANFLSLDFGEGEGDVTSISEIEKKRNAENEAFFNLAGQRVAQPTKGLYIVNGKKVVLK